MFCPFTIERNEEFGRHLISTQAFDVGDILWEESALVSAPDFQSDVSNGNELTLSCVGCYKNLDDASMICTVCRWPCCSDRCSESAVHKKYECKMFARLRTKPTPMNFSKLIYLRLFLCKQVEPPNHEKFQDLCFEVSENDEEYQKICDKEIMDVWKFLAEDCQLRVSVEEVARLWLTFIANIYEFSQVLEGEKWCGHGAYYYASLMAHSCSPNVEFSFFKTVDTNGEIIWNTRLFARKKINARDVLAIAYGPFELQFGTAERQKLIYNNCSFTCLCCRCQEKTEGGTYFQALICQECGKGNLLPVKPMEIVDSPWTCDICHHKEEASAVRAVLRELNQVPSSILNKVPDADSLLKADTFIEDQKQLLHPNHYMFYQCAVHWLLGSNFTVILMSSGQGAEDLFAKILTRAKIYLPLCVEFMPCSALCMMLYVIAETYAAFVFKSSDMQTFVDGDHPLCFKLRICRRIVAIMNDVLQWRKMKPNNYEHDRILTIFWSKKAQKFADEIKKHENLALDSIRYLFS